MKSLLRLIRQNRGLVIFVGLMCVFRSAVADWMVVPTGSMNPTIMEGDRIFVHKMAYGLRVPFTLIRLTDGDPPKRGEVVVFESPADGVTLVKRLIGIPGDRVEMQNERLLINGMEARYQILPEAVGAEMLAEFRDAPHQIENEQVAGMSHPMLLLPGRPAGRSFGPVDVPAGEYLMLGDNRDDSADSRYIGLVPRRLLLGHATRVVASLNPDHHHLPRLDRTLAPLL